MSAERYNTRRALAGAFDIIPHNILQRFAPEGLSAPPGTPEHTKGVRALQSWLGVKADGYLGPKTLRALLARLQASRAPIVIACWLGWARFGRDALWTLKDLGVKEVTVNVNSAAPKAGGGAWAWSPAQGHVHTQIDDSLAVGLNVGVMPWMWWYRRFINAARVRLVELWRRYEGRVRRLQLNNEGSGEVSAKAEAQRLRMSIQQVVWEGVEELVEALDAAGGLDLVSTSTLYWRRPAGSAIMRHPRVRRAVIEAYSTWLRTWNARKNAATHTPAFQPRTLQLTAWNNHDDFLFANDLDELFLGLPGWAQERDGADALKLHGDVPEHLRMGTAEAMRLASSTALDVGAHGVSYWAGHLWDDMTDEVERRYWHLVLDEIRWLDAQGRSEAEPDAEDGAEGIDAAPTADVGPLTDVVADADGTEGAGSVEPLPVEGRTFGAELVQQTHFAGLPTGGILRGEAAEVHLPAIEAAFEAKRWPLRLDGPEHVNVWAVRNDGEGHEIAGRFDDVLYAMRRDEAGELSIHVSRGTVDIDRPYLRRPIHPRGGAITVADVWFENLWRIGIHRAGRSKGYVALVQASNIIVARDRNRNIILDFDATPMTGRFGINQHTRKLRPGADPNLIAGSSAGCWVHMHPERFHGEWMDQMRAAQAAYDAKHGLDARGRSKFRVSSGIFWMSEWRGRVKIHEALDIGV